MRPALDEALNLAPRLGQGTRGGHQRGRFLRPRSCHLPSLNKKPSGQKTFPRVKVTLTTQ